MRLLLKTALLFLAFNLAFAALYPLPQLGRLSAYNRLFPGRLRLPYADRPERAYNLALNNLEAMLASHEISAGPKPLDEYRVILIGDSATWGYLLAPDQTLAAALNDLQLIHPDGRRMRFYNLGYPVMSVMKDLVILSYAIEQQPDLIIWPVTLESMPYDKQLFSPLLQNNPAVVRKLIGDYDLSLDPASPELSDPNLWQRTLVGARRPLADLVRLQLYGVLWAATGIDQDLPAEYTPRQEDLSDDLTFHSLVPPQLMEQDLAFEILSAGIALAGEIPLLLVNEPMFISSGKNSDLRYNFYYPRWAYDRYRALLQTFCQESSLYCLDLWDRIPAAEFTNTAVHLSPAGVQVMAEALRQAILAIHAQP